MSYTLTTNMGEIAVESTDSGVKLTVIFNGQSIVYHLYEAQAVKLAAALLAEATK